MFKSNTCIFIMFMIFFVSNCLKLHSQTSGGFNKTCLNVKANSEEIRAVCKNMKGKYVNTSIKLAQCLRVDSEGNLTPKGTQEMSECSGCSFPSKLTISCKCTYKSGSKNLSKMTTYNLNSGVTNTDGKLTC